MPYQLSSPPDDLLDQYKPFKTLQGNSMEPLGTNLGVLDNNKSGPISDPTRVGGSSGNNIIVSYDNPIKIDF